MRSILFSATAFLMVFATSLTSLIAEEFPLVFKTRTMETVTIDDPQFAAVDIGELQPAGGGDAVFGIIIPQAAVVKTPGEDGEAGTAGVVTQAPEGGLVTREIVLGAESAELAEVVEGVLPGDTVLVTDAERIYRRYTELAELYGDPRRSPDVIRENQLVYERFFLYTGVTLAITIPLIIWLQIRARKGKLKTGQEGGSGGRSAGNPPRPG